MVIPHNSGRHPKPKFISRTGLVDVFTHNAPCFFNGDPRPRGPLEMLATGTIICVLRDIILQSLWSDEWNARHEDAADWEYQDRYTGAKSPSWERS